MSEDAEFNIEQWRIEFDAEIAAVKAHMQPYIAEVVNEIFGDGQLTAEDCVMLWEYHVRADGDMAHGRN